MANGESLSEGENVEQWRREELERAGYSPAAAQMIGARLQGSDKIDLHEAVDLFHSMKESGKYADDAAIEKKALEILL